MGSAGSLRKFKYTSDIFKHLARVNYSLDSLHHYSEQSVGSQAVGFSTAPHLTLEL